VVKAAVVPKRTPPASAEALLKSVIEQVAGKNGFAVDFVLSRAVKDAAQRLRTTYRYVGSRPNKLSLTRVTGTEFVSLKSDGTQCWLSVPAWKRYGQRSAPVEAPPYPNDPEIRDPLGAGDAFFWRFVQSDPARAVLPHGASASSLTETKLGELEAYYVRLTEPDAVRELWFSTSEPAQLLKVNVFPLRSDDETAPAQAPGKPLAREDAPLRTETYTNWELKAEGQSESDFLPDGLSSFSEAGNLTGAALLVGRPLPALDWQTLRDDPKKTGKKEIGKVPAGGAKKPMKGAVQTPESAPAKEKTLLYIWSRWGVNVPLSFDTFDNIHEKHWFKGWDFRAVHVGGIPQDVQSYLIAWNLNSNVAVYDVKGTSVKLLDLTDLPVVILVDRQGTVRAVQSAGNFDPEALVLQEDEVESILAKMSTQTDVGRFLGHVDARVRLGAVNRLVQTPDGLPVLLTALNSPIALETRLLIVNGLSRLPPAALAPAQDRLLEMSLDEDEPQIRGAASRFYANLLSLSSKNPELGGQLLAPLVAALSDDSPARRANAAFTLGLFGPQSLPAREPLVQALQDPQAEVRSEAAQALLRMGKDAIGSLVKTLSSESPEARAAAEKSLLVLGNTALDELALALDDPQLQGPATRVLNQIGTSEVKQVLLGQAKLAQVSATLPAAELVALLSDSDARIQRKAEQALVTQGEPAVSALLPLLAQRDPRLRTVARNALRAMGAPIAGALTQALQQPNPLLRMEACLLLGGLGEAAAPSITLLGNALRDSDEKVREAAAVALSRIGDPGRDALLSALAEPRSEVQVAVSKGLAQVGEKAIPGLVKSLSSPQPSVRYMAASALGQMGPRARDALPALEALRTDPDATVRYYVNNALEKIRK